MDLLMPPEHSKYLVFFEKFKGPFPVTQWQRNCLQRSRGSRLRVPSLGGEDPLEIMTAHSSILAENFPWAEEPGGLWSMGSQSPSVLKRLSTEHTGEN